MKRHNLLLHSIALPLLVTLLNGCAPTPTPTPTSAPLATATLSPTATWTPVVIPTSTLSPCRARAIFGDPAESPYVLPFPVGKSYRVIQSYCSGPQGGHVDQIAYDFGMPVGEDVTAARAGTVITYRDSSPDVDSWEYYNQHNFILIQHEDGTVAFYAHLKQHSVAVRRRDYVEVGQRIAASGNSGLTGGHPHLHFGVYASYPVLEGLDVPVNFRNAGGKLDPNGSLYQGKYYEALPY